MAQAADLNEDPGLVVRQAGGDCQRTRLAKSCALAWE
jgi:hypothetical protein